MGRDKLPLEVGGVPLVLRVHCTLSSCCEEVLIVGADETPSPAGVRRIPDLRPNQAGPLAGIEAGLAAARYQSVLVAAGDMPFLNGDLVRHLLGLLAERRAPAVVPLYGGRPHPLCASYDKEILPYVTAALDRGVRAVRELLDSLPDVLYVGGEELRLVGDPSLLLMNVNSPEDLARARGALGG